MKRLLTILGVLAMSLMLATPALAGHRDRSRGHSRHHVRPHHQRHFAGFHAPAFHHRHRVRPRFFGGFGYRSPFFCGLPAVIVSAPVWIPGHYAYDDGVRFYVRGYWSR